MVEIGIKACTDITGFSLLGHLHEMLISSNLSAEIDYAKVPLYPQVLEMVAMGMIPGGAYRNLEYVKPYLKWHGKPGIKDDALIILADPQTSGGILAAVPPEKGDAFLKALVSKNITAAVIGRIVEGTETTITIR
jgi:selenide, water dikinase